MSALSYAAIMQGSEAERAEESIKQGLARLGIEVRKSGDVATRELWRGEEFLGHFTAGAAAEQFLRSAA